MIPSRNEHTIAASCIVRGRGYWTGKEVSVTIHPATVGSGIRLVRTDLDSAPECLADISSRQDARLRTNLRQGAGRFEMVEHLMAALYAMEIDNCIVEIDGQELPGLDGSALEFARSLQHAGLIVQAASRKRVVIDRPFRVGDGQGWIEALPSRNGKALFEYQLSFDGPSPISGQSYRIELTPRRFIREVAPARTFVTAAQAREIRASGVASHVTNQDLLVIGDSGPIENEYRFTNECARHKTLDLIGDLALANVDLVGSFVSFRGGHRLNAQMAQQLALLAAPTEQPAGLSPPTQHRDAA
ncbi:MAG: UDP-3-O-acyl-N-acetylglucosamine deacetylase [Pirellulales bacterium]|nr:UDP-3-O-acyl-N-acetylglucosamine deacetylase [Pirellulales bacterium]